MRRSVLRPSRALLPALAVLGACSGPSAEPDEAWRHYADRLGDPIEGLSASDLEAFRRGADVMGRDFSPELGLGPSFNADSCHSCHGVPVAGGGAPRYRDFFLVRAPRWDGTLVDVGTNGASPVRNLYAFDGGGHVVHLAEPGETALYARRNAPPMFGVGLFAFVSDAHILSREDPADEDGDGISGRANFEQGRVGRFGVKAQASNLESFNRGAMLNQMGLTSNPLFHMLPEDPVEHASLDPSRLLDPAQAAPLLGPLTAKAQVSAPGEPTTDDDGVPDPELSDRDQLDLLLFSTYLAPPRPAPRTDETRAGAKVFDKIGCTDCHVPTLDSAIGPLPAYTDLLLHDLGAENADGLAAGFASPQEFRTSPLWGVALTGPFLHDGKADTLAEAIGFHGGEGAASRDAFEALDDRDRELLLGFLESLSADGLDQQGLLVDADILPEGVAAPGPDDVGIPGGPLRELTAAERARFTRGQALFDRNKTLGEGLGGTFNGDSCRACHQDPVLGGAAGIDTNVLRMAGFDAEGNPVALDHKFLWRGVSDGSPVRLPGEADLVEARQPQSLLGLGLVEGIDREAILAQADPTDLDGDGISGRVRWVGDRLGRFGWKAQIPTLQDFAADALFVELGLTLPLDTSPFTGTDNDPVPDPEVAPQVADDLTFFMQMLAPPVRKVPTDPAGQAAVDRGEALFTELQCAACHTPELDGVPLYSDLLLHDVAPPWTPLVDQDPGLAPSEFRTPPLWGISDTGPWLHDGTAFTLDQAIERGHHGEAAASREAWLELDPMKRDDLRAFLESL